MSMFRADVHAANPPETWQVVKMADRLWYVVCPSWQPGDGPLASATTRRDAEAETQPGSRLVREYEKEGRWYRGESIPGWRDYGTEKSDTPYIPAPQLTEV